MVWVYFFCVDSLLLRFWRTVALESQRYTIFWFYENISFKQSIRMGYQVCSFATKIVRHSDFTEWGRWWLERHCKALHRGSRDQYRREHGRSGKSSCRPFRPLLPICHRCIECEGGFPRRSRQLGALCAVIGGRFGLLWRIPLELQRNFQIVIEHHSIYICQKSSQKLYSVNVIILLQYFLTTDG